MTDLVKIEVLRGSLRLYFTDGDAEEHHVSISRFPELVTALIADALRFIDHHENPMEMNGLVRKLKDVSH